MVRFTRFIGDMATHPVYKFVIGGVTIVIFSVSTYITLYHSKVGESRPGTPLLFPDHEFNLATAAIADKFGGVDSIVVDVNGDRDNASPTGGSSTTATPSGASFRSTRGRSGPPSSSSRPTGHPGSCAPT
jgi:hypothetical protein